MTDQEFRKFKVIRISHVYAETKKDALKHVQEDIRGEYIAVEFAVEEMPKGFWQHLIKQLTG